MLYTFCNSVPYGGRDLCGSATVLIVSLTNWVASVLACTSCSMCASLCRTMSAVILHYCIIVLTCVCGSYLCQLCLYSIYGMLPGVLVGKSSNNYCLFLILSYRKNILTSFIHLFIHSVIHLVTYWSHHWCHSSARDINILNCSLCMRLLSDRSYRPG